ncbi:GNAT family N-acetyltransferase [Actinokineospora spheciospongiae]|uniref:GNAT family N-acetyltransferase n=1 Tax=Actinokineospora spheciospongiae TaxID=909613 RepID=UPI000D71D4A7|nr:GNAT family protein [Actinokineospora spheciospongiae]PWW65469.1 RimJ/RimL family protein N-acetyltransferase [Actinokineospora spheciospongiae]
MLVGDRVRLRAMEPEDAEPLWRWNNDPEVMRWMVDIHPTTLHDTRTRMAEWPRNSHARLTLGIETRADTRLVGAIALSGAEPEHGRGTIDLYLGERDTWGSGYATEALRLICAYGFDEMRLHSIDLSVVDENAAARRVYAKVGFQEIGRARHAFRRAGHWHDMVLMDLLEPDLVRA